MKDSDEQPTARHGWRSIAVMAALSIGILLPGCAGGDDGETLHVYSGRHYGVETAFERVHRGDRRSRSSSSPATTPSCASASRPRARTPRPTSTSPSTPATWPGRRRAGHLPADRVPDARRRDPGRAARSRRPVVRPGGAGPDDRLQPRPARRPTRCPTTYEDLAEPEWKGRLCLRNSTNVYQQSLVASLIAADGEEDALGDRSGAGRPTPRSSATTCWSWNPSPTAICDVGVANHYYLARQLEENPDFPVALLWANQDDRGAHVNVSGGGVTKHAEAPRARPAVPGVAGHRRPGHPRRRQPRVPGQPRRRARAAHHRAVRDRLQAGSARRRRDRLRSTPRPCG